MRLDRGDRFIPPASADGADRGVMMPTASARTGRTQQAGTKRPAAGKPEVATLVCFSHLRWDLVYQRPQHLLSRAAKDWRVIYFEEPVLQGNTPTLELSMVNGVLRALPHLPAEMPPEEQTAALRRLLDGLLASQGVIDMIAWYYTPLALAHSGHLSPTVTVYDCMDELSLFRGAPAGLQARENELFARADLVFTGGASLYRAKSSRHREVHLFPSSIDRNHFARSRSAVASADVAGLPGPRLGFYGVIDERTDLQLLEELAVMRPEWQFVMLGPVVKISAESLPVRPNLHYPGRRDYSELPSFLAGIDVAIMPFALNDSTRFISPTKTLEYLAAGKRVVSTAITDVCDPYGDSGVVSIAADATEFISHCEQALAEGATEDWQLKVDGLLRKTSWDRTWAGMRQRLEQHMPERMLPVLAD